MSELDVYSSVMQQLQIASKGTMNSSTDMPQVMRLGMRADFGVPSVMKTGQVRLPRPNTSGHK
jgi:hypothetical protein